MRILNNHTLVEFGEKIWRRNSIYLDFTDKHIEFMPKRAKVIQSSDKTLKEGQEIFIDYKCLEIAEEEGAMTEQNVGFIHNDMILGVYDNGLKPYGEYILTRPIINETEKRSMFDASEVKNEYLNKSICVGDSKYFKEGTIVWTTIFGLMPIEYELTKTTEKLFKIDINSVFATGEDMDLIEGFYVVECQDNKVDGFVIDKGILKLKEDTNTRIAIIKKSSTGDFKEGDSVLIPIVCGTQIENLTIIHKLDLIL